MSRAIPVYQIDISQAPEERYRELIQDFGARMRGLTPLFDEVLCSLIPSRILRVLVHCVAKIFLRRVYRASETAELRAIAALSGVDLYLLVALNTLLDSLLGCTSGAVRVSEKGSTGTRIMHFRTLDWAMDGLRDLLVVIEYVDAQGERLGSVVTYAGFVGCLTGVRKDLSISLNFRPLHTCSTLALRWHQLLVLLAFRPSIASVLRQALLSSSSLDSDLLLLTTAPTSPCYVTLGTSEQAVVITKDLYTATCRTSTDFIVVTNHDVEQQDTSGEKQSHRSELLGMETLLQDSRERRRCVSKKWRGKPVRRETVFRWVAAWPTMNECTHFGCVLDPGRGEIAWLERGPDVEEEE